MERWDPQFRMLKNYYQCFLSIKTVCNLLILWITSHCKIERLSVAYINQDMYCAHEINNGNELKLKTILICFIYKNVLKTQLP